MEKMRVMVIGLPGEMATLFANHIEKTEDMKLVPFTLAEEPGMVRIGDVEVWEIAPVWHESRLKEIAPDIIVDFTPSLESVKQNVKLYCRCGIPFLIRNLVADMELVSQTVKTSNVSAVVTRAGTLEVVLKAIRFLVDRKGEKGAVFYM